MDAEVIIVGAGAAGIAAARRLKDHGRRILLVEALGRIGGRAWTVTREGLPLDMGCGWLHSAERNPLVGVAKAQGAILDRTPAAWGNQLRNLGFSVAEQRAARRGYSALQEQLASAPPASDCAGDAMARDHDWRGYADMLSGALNGAELDRVSARDFATYNEAATETDWRLPAGMGTMIAGSAANLPIRMDTQVGAIDTNGRTVAVETSRGMLRSSAVIVAVPTDVLARGAIRFGPGMTDHCHAAACLPLGRVDKLFLGMADPDAVPLETHLIGNPHDPLTGSYYLRPFGRPVIECFFGGIAARAMEEAGDEGRVAFAREELGKLLGAQAVRGLNALAGSWWHREPSIGGAYSHALPGHADKRGLLATPPSDRLAFAGEACSVQDYSTAHGAWQSGIDAANWIEAALARNAA
ncbi:NAD(P)/FAD-dependent oxidoreductase [uncultured Sphingomonas sp.]|uniref:flavin monoamine oxidase family protein n=1 Tax=uncultured Sphingomonas sp. TaxID=158754 RepID=UPI0025EA2482|nr:NAD(P)/FAD-dependent oxidoreductase [uncultured Sphingomonas sp.]